MFGQWNVHLNRTAISSQLQIYSCPQSKYNIFHFHKCLPNLITLFSCPMVTFPYTHFVCLLSYFSFHLRRKVLGLHCQAPSLLYENRLQRFIDLRCCLTGSAGMILNSSSLSSSATNSVGYSTTYFPAKFSLRDFVTSRWWKLQREEKEEQHEMIIMTWKSHLREGKLNWVFDKIDSFKWMQFNIIISIIRTTRGAVTYLAQKRHYDGCYRGNRLHSTTYMCQLISSTAII